MSDVFAAHRFSTSLVNFRGIPCPVDTPHLGFHQTLPMGIGVGWSDDADGHEQCFFSVHAEGGFAMVAQLDSEAFREFGVLLNRVRDQAPNCRKSRDLVHSLNAAGEALKDACRLIDTNDPRFPIIRSAIDGIAEALKGTPERREPDPGAETSVSWVEGVRVRYKGPAVSDT